MTVRRSWDSSTKSGTRDLENRPASGIAGDYSPIGSRLLDFCRPVYGSLGSQLSGLDGMFLPRRHAEPERPRPRNSHADLNVDGLRSDWHDVFDQQLGIEPFREPIEGRLIRRR